jgi:hypothetical protein
MKMLQLNQPYDITREANLNNRALSNSKYNTKTTNMNSNEITNEGAGGTNGNLKMDLQFFAKKDLKMVNDAANQVGVDRNLFGEYIHEVKADLGMKANENFTYKELIDLAKELKNILKE